MKLAELFFELNYLNTYEHNFLIIMIQKKYGYGR